MLHLVNIEPLDSKSNTLFWANWAFACKTETLGFYSIDSN